MNLSTVIAERGNKTVYRDGKTAVKLFDGTFGAADVLNEALNHAIVYETGFAVPQLIEVAKTDGKWAIVTEFIEGDTLLRKMVDQPEENEGHIARLVDIQLRMHSFNAKRLRHHTDKMYGKIQESGLDPTAIYELHTRLNSLPRHDKLCHGDFMPENIIITPSDDVYVLDWSHATQGNASADAARTYLRFLLADSALFAEQYLAFFCEKSGTARSYVQKWLPIVAASQLVKGKPKEKEFLLKWTDVVEYE
ncbi:MAG: aminoglycoside phosphotransferase family protein [Peptococcaceae bacterium]|jgi:aminoglycoside phosphotransferase (APT) family kinase protein|nr:aminoglycoside phosphotransferase family protein [Peptococcaceae bacterium]